MISFLGEWALRSSALILVGTALLWVTRVKDSSTRLTAWTAMLMASLLIPVMSAMLPNIPIRIMPAQGVPAAAETTILPLVGAAAAPSPHSVPAPASTPFDWPRAVLALYVLVALGMLLRLGVGLVLSSRLIRGSRRTDRDAHGIAVLESSGIPSPVTLGIVRPVIVLPASWMQWDEAKLNAVLAHERSHILRHDPVVQVISVIHRALLWFNPLAWFLHSRIVRIAEEVSDDAAVAVTADRTVYAEILLDFMRCPEPSAGLAGLPMSRYGRADQRLHRILDATTFSQGLTRASLITILALGSPLAYVLATARPQTPPAISKTPVGEVTRTAVSVRKPESTEPQGSPDSLMGLGTVSGAMVTVHPQADGTLLSVAFREGQMVKSGDTLAMLDAAGYQDELARTELRIDLDKKQLADATARYRAGVEPEDAMQRAGNAVSVDEQVREQLRQKIAATSVKAPISGVAGLRLVEPGNVVHASDEKGIVVIAQVQPISVLFTLPERSVPLVRAPLDAGRHPVAEAWNADSSARLATGFLTAMDNQIDSTSGTIKLKATFENKDNKLFPSQFVNVRVFLK